VPTVTTYDALLSGHSWNGIDAATRPTFLTYSFDLSASPAFAAAYSADFLGSFHAFTAAEQDIGRQALRAWADVSGLTLFEVPAGQGDIRFGVYDFSLGPEDIQNSLGFAFAPFVLDFPDGAWEEDFGGDIFIDIGHANFDILIHEIGHALGLKHPFAGEPILEAALDDLAHTVMTYNPVGGPAIGLGTLDILAVQHLYGGAESDGTQAATGSWNAASLVLSQTGGAGGDFLAGVAVADRITAGAGDDYVMGRGGADQIDGEDGADTLAGGAGGDTVSGGAGNDVIDGDDGDDALNGGADDDSLWGLDGNDTLAGEAGDDFLHAGAGVNRLLGGAGNDVIVVADGASFIEGGEGYDELWLAPPNSAGVSLSYADLTAGGGTYTGIEAVVLFGDVNIDTLQGGALPDVLVGDAGGDSLSGGASEDELWGDSGADTLAGGSGDDYLEGGSGDDLFLAGDGADDIRGGTGLDTVDFSADLEGVDVTINAPRSLAGAIETMRDIENLVGTLYADNIVGDAGLNRLFGGGGADTIRGGHGFNYLRGDDGNDSLGGGAGFDDINGNVGDDSASGGLGNDWVVGGKDRDRLTGDDGDDLVYGNLGADTCEGGAGADTIRGGQQDDVLVGGAGADYLSGDRDNDTVTGGDGADIFHTFGDAGIDRVTDFSLAEGDRVMVDPGDVFTVAQAGADTVISMAGGGQMVLVGVTMTSLTGGWIFGA
jgi:Ca2+-binding RTX toxin-like protein